MSLSLGLGIEKGIKVGSGTTPPLFQLKPDSDMSAATFTGNSLATYIAQDGLVRRAPNNAVLYSEDFSPAGGWQGYQVVGPGFIGNTTAPDGSNTAAVLDFTGSPNGAAWYVDAAFPFGDLGITTSVWVKCASGTQPFQLGASGVLTPYTATTTWQRFQTSDPVGFSQISLRATGATGIIHVWGAQLELNISAGPYVKTTGTRVLRTPRNAHYVQGNRTLLLEGERTNSLQQSSDLSQAIWIKSGGVTVTANAATAPDGSNTASLINANAGALGAGDFVSQGIGPNTGMYSFSIWVRAAAPVSVALRLTNAGVAAGTRVNIAVTTTWQRFSINSDFGGGSWTPQADILCNDGTNGQSIFVWGAQLELGPSASSLIYTTTAAVTRALEWLTFPYPKPPEELTIFVRAYNVGSNDVTDSILNIGGMFSQPNVWALKLIDNNAGIRLTDDPDLQELYAYNVIALNNMFEYRGTLSATGAVQAGVSVNSGVEVLSLLSTAVGLPVAWGDPTLWVASTSVGYNSYFAFRDIIIAKGVKDLAYFRGLIDPGVDADYYSFITRAGITDPTQKTALSDLVAGLKSNNIWSKLKAVYPFVGGTAAAHSLNLVAATFPITWTAVTHNANGITGNGTTAFGSIAPPASLWTVNSGHGLVYNRTATPTTGGSFYGAVQSTTATSRVELAENTTGFIGSTGFNSNDFVGGTGITRTIGLSRINSTTSLVIASRTITTFASTSILAPTTVPLLLLARAFEGFPNDKFNNANLAFASFGSALTNVEMLLYNDLIHAFQTALGRQV